ncbi:MULTISPECIES: hypothetical protein [unclassified Acidovorax]|uniref:hypothetical protein n=1 Tax=unclassified Acidovorax TaxID=2684926 RepID=UPI0028831879|nr:MULTISPECIES: hypothetical protein [unclassified Acidovorax]
MRSFLTVALIASTPLLAHAQSTCTSDGQPQPVALVERFISADCESCWAESTRHTPGPSAVVVDWIVPSASTGDEAPLAAAATRDALERLQQLQRPAPNRSDTHVSDIASPAPGRLRVMVGPAVNDYRGVAISVHRKGARPAPAAGYRYTLLLIETIPAGTEGTTTPRHLARNALQDSWNKRNQLPKGEQWLWTESRSMRIPEGADPDRMSVVGWLEDASGHIVAAAQSRCAAPR